MRFAISTWSFLRDGFAFFFLSAGAELERRVVAVPASLALTAGGTSAGLIPFLISRLRASCAAMKFLRASPSLMVGT